jgi:hypothetical protein
MEGLWSFSLYPEAGEGGGSLSVRRVLVPSDRPPNVQRAQEEAARRARARIRRYGAANRLNRLGTLTYRGEGCHDPLRLRMDLAGFFRELRERLGAGRAECGDWASAIWDSGGPNPDTFGLSGEPPGIGRLSRSSCCSCRSLYGTRTQRLPPRPHPSPG